MGRRYAIHSSDDVYFVTFTVVNWIDIFTRDEYREIFIDSMVYCQKNKGLEVFAYCIMTNHVHLVIGAKEGFELSDIVRDLKSFTSRHIRKAIEQNEKESRREWMLWMFGRAGKKNHRNKDFQFWLQHSHPVALTTQDMLHQRINYTHQNPVRAGFVAEAHDWIWSSARAYAEIEKSKVDLTMV